MKEKNHYTSKDFGEKVDISQERPRDVEREAGTEVETTTEAIEKVKESGAEQETERQKQIEKIKKQLEERPPESIESKETKAEVIKFPQGPLEGGEEKARYKSKILNWLFGTKGHKREFKEITEPIIQHPTFQEDGKTVHHWPFNREDHLVATARIAHSLARIFRRNKESTQTITQAALVHDINSDWGKVQGAIDFAGKLGLSKRVQELVSEQKVSLKGSGLDSFIVKASDVIVTLGETASIIGYILKKPHKRIPLIIRRTIHEIKKARKK